MSRESAIWTTTAQKERFVGLAQEQHKTLDVYLAAAVDFYASLTSSQEPESLSEEARTRIRLLKMLAIWKGESPIAVFDEILKSYVSEQLASDLNEVLNSSKPDNK